MTASVSGMAAQANNLATISENISNASTTGYKQTSTLFQDIVDQFGTTGDYSAGGVSTTIPNEHEPNRGYPPQRDSVNFKQSADLGTKSPKLSPRRLWFQLERKHDPGFRAKRSPGPDHQFELLPQRRLHFCRDEYWHPANHRLLRHGSRK